MTLVVLSGCSGAGKSTLLDGLARRGLQTVEEAGRRVVRAALAGSGGALPEREPIAFATCCAQLILGDVAALPDGGALCVMDRGPLDVASWLAAHGLEPPPALREALRLPLAEPVLWAPPWPGIFRQDKERRHDLASALAESARLAPAYVQAGHTLLTLPLSAPEPRVDWAMAALAPWR